MSSQWSLSTLLRAVRGLLRPMFCWMYSIGLKRHSRGPSPVQIVASRLSVVIAVHDSPEVLVRCLTSLARVGAGLQVIIVDDASLLPETNAILRDHAVANGWQVIRLEHRRGHSFACNAGSAVADREFICLLNSDTIVTPHSWNAVIDTFDRDPLVAIAGPSTSWCAGSQAHPRARTCRHYWSDLHIDGFASRNAARHPGESGIAVEFVSGFALFVRRSVWRELGGFHPELPDYGNDNEFCGRVAKAGLKAMWVKGAYVHHLGQQTYGRFGSGYRRRAVGRTLVNNPAQAT